MKKSITVRYQLGEEVILKTDPEVKRIVTGYLLRLKSVTYGLAKGEEETWHNELEIASTGKPFKVKGFR